jgi:ubiquitin-conjugating enzyme E2 O
MAIPTAALSDPLMRPLTAGEVGVSWLTENAREILSESELQLLDRTLQPGDLCKQSVEDIRSAVVTAIHTKCRIEHVISKESVEGWKTSDDFHHRSDAEIGDYVVYNDWVGQVRPNSVYYEVVCRLNSCRLSR